MTYSPEKCCKIIIACMILHNMCIQANIPLEEDEDDSNDDADGNEDNNERAGAVNAQYGHIDAGNYGWQVRQNLVANRFTVRG